MMDGMLEMIPAGLYVLVQHSRGAREKAEKNGSDPSCFGCILSVVKQTVAEDGLLRRSIGGPLKIARIALSFVALLPALPALAGNIVLNPGFETGDLTDWVVNTNADLPWIVQASPGRSDKIAFDGTFYANTGCVGPQCITNDVGSGSPVGAWLYQDLATPMGTTYTLSFEFSSEGPPMELLVLWNGSEVEDLVDLPNPVPDTQYTLYTVSGLTVTSGTTRLEFIGRQDPGYDALDNVCVSSTTDCGVPSSVPEPATSFLFGGGFSGLGLLAIGRRFLLRRS